MEVPYGGQRALLSSSRPLRAPSERIQKSPSRGKSGKLILHYIKELSVYQEFNSVSTDGIDVGILDVFKFITYIIQNGGVTNRD